MLFSNKRKYIGIGQNELKNIGIRDIGKNPISWIPSLQYECRKIFTLYNESSYVHNLTPDTAEKCVIFCKCQKFYFIRKNHKPFEQNTFSSNNKKRLCIVAQYLDFNTVCH